MSKNKKVRKIFKEELESKTEKMSFIFNLDAHPLDIRKY